MELYEKAALIITSFDVEDVITTSGTAAPEDPISADYGPEEPFGNWW